ncbi:MAG: hypothetical protein ACXWHZ_03705 [Usitatibacter sp.]
MYADYVPAPLPCRYCGKPVAPDFDHETGRYSSPIFHLFECWHSLREGGRFAVITNSRWDDASRGFPTALRALDQAEDYARSNYTTLVLAVIDTQTGELVKIVEGKLLTPHERALRYHQGGF